jgi:hypothetical protein
MRGQPGGHLGEVGLAVVVCSRIRLCRKGDGDHPLRRRQDAHLPDQVSSRRRRSPATLETGVRNVSDAPALVGFDPAHEGEDRCVRAVAHRNRQEPHLIDQGPVGLTECGELRPDLSRLDDGRVARPSEHGIDLRRGRGRVTQRGPQRFGRRVVRFGDGLGHGVGDLGRVLFSQRRDHQWHLHRRPRRAALPVS